MLLESTNLSIINNFSGPGNPLEYTFTNLTNNIFSGQETLWDVINQCSTKTSECSLISNQWNKIFKAQTTLDIHRFVMQSSHYIFTTALTLITVDSTNNNFCCSCVRWQVTAGSRASGHTSMITMMMIHTTVNCCSIHPHPQHWSQWSSSIAQWECWDSSK